MAATAGAAIGDLAIVGAGADGLAAAARLGLAGLLLGRDNSGFLRGGLSNGLFGAVTAAGTFSILVARRAGTLGVLVTGSLLGGGTTVLLAIDLLGAEDGSVTTVTLAVSRGAALFGGGAGAGGALSGVAITTMTAAGALAGGGDTLAKHAISLADLLRGLLHDGLEATTCSAGLLAAALGGGAGAGGGEAVGLAAARAGTEVGLWVAGDVAARSDGGAAEAVDLHTAARVLLLAAGLAGATGALTGTLGGLGGH